MCSFLSGENQKKGEELCRTAQPPTLAVFPPWGSSEGAGRTVLTHHKSRPFIETKKDFLICYFEIPIIKSRHI